jgi:hypothetical protein
VSSFLLRLRQKMKPSNKTAMTANGTPTPMPALAPVDSPDDVSPGGDGLLEVVLEAAEVFNEVVDMGVGCVVAIDTIDEAPAVTEARTASSELCHHTCTPSAKAIVFAGSVLYDKEPRSQLTPLFVGRT